MEARLALRAGRGPAITSLLITQRFMRTDCMKDLSRLVANELNEMPDQITQKNRDRRSVTEKKEGLEGTSNKCADE
jgi:hypothetical protein